MPHRSLQPIDVRVKGSRFRIFWTEDYNAVPCPPIIAWPPAEESGLGGRRWGAHPAYIRRG